MTIKLITVQELVDQIGRATEPLVIIDARQREFYEKGHIPGAMNSPWESWSQSAPAGSTIELLEAGWWGVLDDPWKADFASRLERMGVSNESDTIVYADGWISNGREGRLAWMLAYLGIHSVQILNGGWKAWTRTNGEIEQTTPCPKKGKFEIKLDNSRRHLMEEIRNLYKNGNPVLIDTRTPEEFAGVCPDDPQSKTGHMPGAINIPYKKLFNSDGTYIDRATFAALLPAQLWDRQLISYCEVGVKAGTFAALCETYMDKIVPVFDGSIRQWAECPDAKVVKEKI